MAAALNRALADALRDDETVLVFGEDVGTLGGVFRITDGLAAAFGEDRCFDTPLAESGIVGIAVGHGHERHAPGRRDAVRRVRLPGVRADRQPRRQDAQPHPGTRRRCPIVIRIPYGGGIGGVEHHCDSSEAYYAHTAGPAGRHPGHARRRLRAAARRPSTPPTRSSSWSPSAATGRRRPRSWTTTASAHRPGRRAPAGHRRHAHRLRRHAAVPRWRPPTAAAGGGPQRRGHRPALACPRSTTRPSARRSGGPAAPSWSHEAAGFCGVRRRDRRARVRAVLPLPGAPDPAGHRASTSRTRRRSWSSIHLPGVDRILDAVDRLQWDETAP